MPIWLIVLISVLTTIVTSTLSALALYLLSSRKADPAELEYRKLNERYMLSALETNKRNLDLLTNRVWEARRVADATEEFVAFFTGREG